MLFIAKTINVAADLGAMGGALKLLVGGPAPLYVVVFGAVSVVAQIFFRYERYVAVLKWLTLVLFAYEIDGMPHRAIASSRSPATFRTIGAG